MRHIRKIVQQAIFTIVVATLFPAVGAAEQTSDLEVTKARIDRFKLWSDCRPMLFAVEDLTSDAADIGLTEEAIKVAVRSRLRSARIYYDVSARSLFRRSYLGRPQNFKRPLFLYISVHVVGAAFSVGVSLKKDFRDASSGETGSATTWETGSTGTHGRSGNYILSSVSRHMDKFIDEYLRVNAEACTR